MVVETVEPERYENTGSLSRSDSGKQPKWGCNGAAGERKKEDEEEEKEEEERRREKKRSETLLYRVARKRLVCN